MMEHESLLTCVDDFAVVEAFKLLCELSLFGKSRESVDNGLVDCLGCVIVGKSACHRNAVVMYSFCAGFTCHDFGELYAVSE